MKNVLDSKGQQMLQGSQSCGGLVVNCFCSDIFVERQFFLDAWLEVSLGGTVGLVGFRVAHRDVDAPLVQLAPSHNQL